MDIVERLNTLLESMDECRIASFDGSTLTVFGDFDLSYHHNFEARFIEVSFLQCATSFQSQKFRLADENEKNIIKLSECADNDEEVYCFEFDGRGFFVAARKFELREELIRHY